MAHPSMPKTESPTRNVTQPGTWHDSAPHRAVARETALAAWQVEASAILKEVAGVYGETVTYSDLKNRQFEKTGYRTRQLVHH